MGVADALAVGVTAAPGGALAFTVGAAVWAKPAAEQNRPKVMANTRS